MSDQANPEERQSSARGEAAWKETMERVAARNQAARKAGKESRAAYERQRNEARRAAEIKRQSTLVARRRTHSRPSSP